MKSRTVLIVGCGDLGARTGEILLAEGWEVIGLRRDVSRLPAGFTPLAADYTRPGDLDGLAALAPAFVLATPTPADRTVAGYQLGYTQAMRNLAAGLGGHRPRAVIVVSSTRVYAENDGGWVEEHSPLTATDECALAILAAERALVDAGLAASAVRFSGIYGAAGGRLLARVAGGGLSPAQPCRYSNRIHRDDCAGFLAHLLRAACRGDTLEPVYLGSDDLPAPRHEVESWLFGQLRERGRVAPEAVPHTVEDTRTQGHRRCRNRALTASGYRLRYPDYRAGYTAVLDGG